MRQGIQTAPTHASNEGKPTAACDRGPLASQAPTCRRTSPSPPTPPTLLKALPTNLCLSPSATPGRHLSLHEPEPSDVAYLTKTLDRELLRLGGFAGVRPTPDDAHTLQAALAAPAEE